MTTHPTMYSYGITGNRPINEDRIDMRTIRTHSGLILHVGIVCDGMGGEGVIAAQLTLDTVFGMIANSHQADVLQIMAEAVHVANQQVFEMRRGAVCTLAMVIVHQDGSPFGRLYVGNVGDSRIGLVRSVNQKGKRLKKPPIHWLNRSHTVADDAIWDRGLDRKTAYQSQNAHALTRTIGQHADVELDYGFYNQAQDVQQALSRGYRGLELFSADTLIICSDGVSDAKGQSQSLIKDDELVKHALTNDVQRTVRLLLGLADQRQASDNASLGFMLIDPESPMRRKGVSSKKTSPLFYALCFILLILSFAVGVIFFMRNNMPNNTQEFMAVGALQVVDEPTAIFTVAPIRTEQSDHVNNLEGTVQALEATLAYVPPTDAPTKIPSMIPSLVAGQVGMFYSDLSSGKVVNTEDTIIDVNDFMVDIIYPNAPSESANIYALAESSLRLDNVNPTHQQIGLTSYRGSTFIVESGMFNRILSVNIAGTMNELRLNGSCMLVNHQEIYTEMTCYAGNCSFTQMNSGIYQDLPVGYKVRIDNLTHVIDEPMRFDPQDTQAFRWLETWNKGDYDSCQLGDYMPPLTSTPVPQQQPTRVQSTNVPPRQQVPTNIPPTHIPQQQQQAIIQPTSVPQQQPTRISPTHIPQQTEYVYPTSIPSTSVPYDPPINTQMSVQPTHVPSTPVPPTPVPPTPVPPTPVPPTPVPPTPVPSTPVPPTPVPPTPVPPTPVPPTPTPISPGDYGGDW